ncbi:MAG TPA: tetratricopeptide repeat protein [Thermoanaerobaculia bacterium]|nr:tetratricopeptide repeat protein [Thermoanaerobaculia bacterium]
MSLRFRAFSTLTALALTCAVSSAWAEDAIVREDSLRAMQRAELLIQQKQFKSAAAAFERASELAGGSCPECLLGTARAYRGAGELDAAIQVTRMALSLSASPDGRARAYDQLGSILTLKGDMDSARKAFQKAVELDGRMAGQVRSSMAQALLMRASSAAAPALQ